MNPKSLCLLFLLCLVSLQWAFADQQASWRFDQPDQTTSETMNLEVASWQPVIDQQTLNFGFIDQAVWLKLGPFHDMADHVLVIGYPLIDDLQLFWVADGEVIEQYHTGDLRAFDTRPVAHRQFVFPFPKTAGDVTVYLRAETEGALQLPYEIAGLKDFLESDQLALTWQALFTGIMLALVVYNAFLYLTTRQVVYFWYILTVAFTALVQLNIHGITFQWLWPDFPAFNEKATVVSIALNIITAAVFTVLFLEARRYSMAAARVLYGVITLGCLSLVVGILANYKTGVLVATLTTFLVTIVMWFVAFYLWKKGQIIARFYLVAWTPVILGHILMSTSKAGVLPYSRIYDFAPQIGGALEVLLLSFALAYQINLERQRRQEAQQHALALEREAKENLEIKVSERTRELEILNAQLRTMTLTDGLTKVANRRRFDEKLLDEWNRGPRHGQPLSLLVMDVDYFKKVNDTYGHLAGDDCLVTVAERCSKQIHRAGDLLARYGGEEFVVLLPCTPAKGAVEIAERMRKAVEEKPVQTGSGHAIALTISIGVTTMVTDRKQDADILVRSADEALYAAKTAGRNRVQLADEAYLGEFLRK
jgi:diguanylate cyclase (GGDEF)-like protein